MGSPAVLDQILAEAQGLGYLGPAPVEAHRAHCLAFVLALRPVDRILDLGSGGGLPGLVIAEHLPHATVVLLDSRLARTDFLRRAVGRLGWGDRIGVRTARAETEAHDPAWRGSFGAVVARGFGRPARVAECAAGFLAPGGQLVVSEPPDADQRRAHRWPPDGLALLGLTLDEPASGRVEEVQVRSCTLTRACPPQYPRPSRRPPLW